MATAILLHFGFWWWLDYGPPAVRDPEFGMRLNRLKARTAENPDRPLVLVLGSSRTSMGVRASATEPRPGEPIFLNMAVAGSGTIMELMVFHRVLEAGYRPKLVLIEYWPAFLDEEGIYHEGRRTEASRISPADMDIVEEFFPESEKIRIRNKLHERRVNPWLAHRKTLMNRISPGWLTYSQRYDAQWENLDDWGWLPGRERDSIPTALLPEAMRMSASYYKPLFTDYQVSEVANRALRQLVTECREKKIPVALFYMPETAAFREFMPPKVKKIADEHLRQVCEEMRLPLIDTRGWVPDDVMPDGFHMIQTGASEFTKKFIPAVIERFPEIGER